MPPRLATSPMEALTMEYATTRIRVSTLSARLLNTNEADHVVKRLKCEYCSPVDALELKHPTARVIQPSEPYMTLGTSGELSDYGSPTPRYFTIGGHGRRGSASVIGVPRLLLPSIITKTDSFFN